MKILVIDDESQIRRFLRISLGSQGYDVIEAETGEEGISKAAIETPRLIILDLGLPDVDGQQVLATLRDFYQGPILVLSVRNNEFEKVSALDAGANDYVVKPFGVKELLARLRGLLRVFENEEPKSLIFDDGILHIDIINRRISVNGSEKRLTRKEFDILKLLLSHSGRIVTQQQILREVWGPNHSHDAHYLRIFIAKLRNKLNDNPMEPRYVETEPGVGYRFIGE